MTQASDLGTGFSPYPGAQTRFFTASEDVVFYGGAGGGGKSLMGMLKFTQQLVVEHGRFRKGEIKRSKAWAIYLRRKSTDLEQMVDLSHEYFPEFDPKAKYNANTTTWVFPSCGGAKFTFDHCQHEKDKFKFKSSSWTYMFFDELTEFTETQFLYIQSRLRSADPVLSKMLQVCAGSNPDGEGLFWVRDMFVESKEPGKVYRTRITLENGEVREKDSIFIPARLKDNPALYESGQYELQLRGLPPEIQEAILNGNWYYASGAYLARVWDSRYHVCPNHAVPSGASITRSMDYGYSKPGSCTWWYLDRDGVLTAFYNLYLTEHTPEMWAARIQEVEEEFGLWDEENNCSRITGPLDTGCWDKQNSKTCVAQRLREKGVRFFKAKKGPGSRLNSAVELISRMRMRIKSEASPDDRLQDKPGIRWMERCGAPIRTLPILRPDPNNAEDVDSSGEDHCVAPYTIVHTKEGDIEVSRLVGREGFVLSSDGTWRRFHSVRRTQQNVDVLRLTTVDGRVVVATHEHKVLTVDGWKALGDLSRGERIVDVGQWLGQRAKEENPFAIIESVERAGRSDVYNLEVDGTHCFAVSYGLIVHNCYDEARYECASKPLIPLKEQDPDEDDVDNVVDIRSGQGRVGVGKWAARG